MVACEAEEPVGIELTEVRRLPSGELRGQPLKFELRRRVSHNTSKAMQVRGEVEVVGIKWWKT